ncbi:MAG: hypothetical protein JST65_01705 [Acidobacteria bacterium]|nr:hypothetical protein [Acidobacteriota bacterium]
MMKATLATWGGLAPLLATPAVHVDDADLSKEDAATFRSLATQVKDQPARPANPRARDARSYEVTFETPDGASTTVEQTDATMTPEFADLLQFLRRHHRRA